MCTVLPFAGGHLEYLKFLKDTWVGSRISRIQGQIKQKSSKKVSHTNNPGWSYLVLVCVGSSNLWYTFISALY